MAFKLDVNVPRTLELEYADGLTVQSKFGGDQVMFTLTNGEKFYADPFVADKIRRAGIGAYTPFNLCKREVITGNRRTIEYEIEVLDEPKTVTDPRPTVHASTKYDGKTTAVLIGAGASVNAPAAPAVSGTAAPSPSTVAMMKMAGIGAIDAVLDIEQYAQSRGMTDFAFGPENIQKIAVTIFMEMAKKGGRA